MRAATIGLLKRDGTPAWLYDTLSRLIEGQQQNQAGMGAILRGEAPDGSGNPLFDTSLFFYKPGLRGGQVGFGATESGGTLLFSSTAHSTKGKIYLGTVAPRFAYDEANAFLGLGTDTPAAVLHLYGRGTAAQSGLPVSDVAGPTVGWGKNGSPTPSTFAACMNDSDDTTFARATPFLGTNSMITQGPVMTDPLVDTGFQLKFTMRATSDKTNFRMTISLINASGSTIISSIDYGGPSNTTHGANWQQDITTGFAVYTYTLTAGQCLAWDFTQAQRIGFQFAGIGTDPTHFWDISRVEFVIPGAAGATALFKAENAVAGAIFGSFDSDTDWSFTGTNKISFRNGPSAASGLRLYSDTGLARLEAGSAAGALKILLIGGYGASALTSLRIAGQTMISDTASPAAPGALLDVFAQSDQKVLRLRPHSSQTADILQVRNNGDSTTFAAIDSTGKIVANIGLQLSAQSPAAGKIATSSDASGNFTWSSPSVVVTTWPYVAKTSNYTVTTADGIVEGTTGTFTITLPTAVGVAGRMYAIKNSGTGVVTVATTSSQTIDGATTAVLATQFESITVFSDGANWRIM